MSYYDKIPLNEIMHVLSPQEHKKLAYLFEETESEKADRVNKEKIKWQETGKPPPRFRNIDEIISKIQQQPAKNNVPCRDARSVEPCTPDWEFNKIFDRQVGRDQFGYKCNCGSTYSEAFSYAIDIEKAREFAFRTFTIHKLAGGVDDGVRFNEVWDECFPVAAVKKNNRLDVTFRIACMLIAIVTILNIILIVIS